MMLGSLWMSLSLCSIPWEVTLVFLYESDKKLFFPKMNEVEESLIKKNLVQGVPIVTQR